MIIFWQNLIVNSFDLFVLQFFMQFIFKQNKKRSWWVFGILGVYAILLSFVMTYFNWFDFNLIYYLLTTWLVLGIQKGALERKFLWSVYICVVDFIMESLTLLLLYLYFQKLWNIDFQLNNYFLGMLCFVLLKVFGLVILMYILKYKMQGYYLFSKKIFLLLASFPLISFVLVIAGSTDLIIQDFPVTTIYNNWLATGLLLLNTLLLLLFAQLNRAHEKMMHRQMVEAQVVAKTDYYHDLENTQQEMHKIQHDLKNGLLTLNGLLLEEQMVEAQAYLDEVLRDVAKTEVYSYTPNNVLNYLLAQKIKKAEEKHIEVVVDCFIPEKFKLPINVIATVFGNLLDNAIEACEKINKDPRKIVIKIKYFKAQLYIDISNTMDEAEVSLPLKTTKRDKRAHGYGLKSVEQIVKEYEGILKIWSENHWFYVNIVLWDMQKEEKIVF